MNSNITPELLAQIRALQEAGIDLKDISKAARTLEEEKREAIAELRKKRDKFNTELANEITALVEKRKAEFTAETGEKPDARLNVRIETGKAAEVTYVQGSKKSKKRVFTTNRENVDAKRAQVS